MTQDERWLAIYNEVVEFIETNHRNPSRHRNRRTQYAGLTQSHEKKDECWRIKGRQDRDFRIMLADEFLSFMELDFLKVKI